MATVWPDAQRKAIEVGPAGSSNRARSTPLKRQPQVFVEGVTVSGCRFVRLGLSRMSLWPMPMNVTHASGRLKRFPEPIHTAKCAACLEVLGGDRGSWLLPARRRGVPTRWRRRKRRFYTRTLCRGGEAGRAAGAGEEGVSAPRLLLGRAFHAMGQRDSEKAVVEPLSTTTTSTGVLRQKNRSRESLIVCGS